MSAIAQGAWLVMRQYAWRCNVCERGWSVFARPWVAVRRCVFCGALSPRFEGARTLNEEAK